MEALAAALPAMPLLTTLHCNANAGVGETGWAALSAALRWVPALASLQLEACSGIGDAGASALAAGIPGAAKLETINLHGCAIGDNGAKALAVRRDCAFDFGLRRNICKHALMQQHQYMAAT
jgi:hypothetical protein